MKRVVKSLDRYLPEVLILLLFLSVVPAIYQFDNHEIDTDEGIVLGKALLLSNGHNLYAEIWSDHPSMMTYFVAFGIKVFGHDLNFIRIMCWGLNFLGIIFLIQLLRLFYHKIAVLLAILLLITSHEFLINQITVMRGAPALSLAIISSFYLLLFLHKSPKYKWLVLAGVLAAISLLFKLFTGYIFLSLGIYSFIILWKRKDKVLAPLLIWGGTSLLFFLAIGLWSGLFLGTTQWSSHFATNTVTSFEEFDNLKVVSHFLKKLWPLLTLSVVAIAKGFKRNVFPLALIVLTLGILLIHKPVHAHYILLISFPLAVLTCSGLHELMKLLPYELPNGIFRIISGVALIVFLATVFVKIKDAIKIAQPIDVNVVERLQMLKKEGDYMFTGRPVYSYLSGVNNLPYYAVMSHKRRVSGSVNPERILHDIQKKRPKFVLIDRFKGFVLTPAIEAYLKENYAQQIDVHPGFYVLK